MSQHRTDTYRQGLTTLREPWQVILCRRSKNVGCTLMWNSVALLFYSWDCPRGMWERRSSFKNNLAFCAFRGFVQSYIKYHWCYVTYPGPLSLGLTRVVTTITKRGEIKVTGEAPVWLRIAMFFYTYISKSQENVIYSPPFSPVASEIIWLATQTMNLSTT